MDLGIVRNVLVALQGHTLGELIVTLLSNDAFSADPLKQLFILQLEELLRTLIGFPETKSTVHAFAKALHTASLTEEVALLANKESGWHISARHAQVDQLEKFSIEDMARKLRFQAPVLWELLGSLLESDPARSGRRARFFAQKTGQNTSDASGVGAAGLEGNEWDEEDEYWWEAEVEDDCEEGLEHTGMGCPSDEPHGNEPPKKRQRKAGERRSALVEIRRVVIISIFMFSTNQRCNVFAAAMGMFFHSTSTPELVVEVFAHAGLSVSLTAIHQMITSMSRSSISKLRTLAKTKVMAFAYDNFDMDFKNWKPTVENSGSTLKHATSALAFPLLHGVMPDDLKCASELWSTSPLNPDIPPTQHRSAPSWIRCLRAPDPNAPDYDRKTRIFAWHFRNALVTYCQAFEHFRKDLGMPETVLQIPVVQTTHIPCYAMDINQSTVDGQSEILENLFMQANIGDPSDTPGVEDITEYIIPVHGDLGAGERLDGAQHSRAIERKAVRGLRTILFILGLFHLQIACVDALWRMFIEPKDLRTNPNGLFQQACRVRPHDSGRIGSNPGFRLMHDLVLQCATARMLDIWRVEVEQSYRKTLDEFAASKPTWAEIEKLSCSIATKYLEKTDAKDQEFRNNSLILTRLLYYVELTHAMKHGDVGRAEDTFMHWVFVFISVGKHKYATQLIKIMYDLKYVYSERLARAIRLNWLCNPTGKPDGFRAIDWLVELMNLFIKVVYSSSGSTRTFQLIIKQSPLIEVFRRVHRTMQENFHLMHRSVRHAPPDVRNTIQLLCNLLKTHKAHVYEEGRTTEYRTIVDHLRDGMKKIQAWKPGMSQDSTDGIDDSTGMTGGELSVDDLSLDNE